MIRKKVCLIGGFAVGKTSLVRRFVHSRFDERYQTTVGVKVDKKPLTIAGRELTLMLWDLYGEDPYQELRMSYLRGSAGFLFVADGTRATTLVKALELRERALAAVGDVPHLMLVNKHDLEEDWEVDRAALDEVPCERRLTSALTGDGVESAFDALGRALLANLDAGDDR